MRRCPSSSDTTIKYELHDVIANDDHAIALGTATATRNGKTLDIPDRRDLSHPRWPGGRALGLLGRHGGDRRLLRIDRGGARGRLSPIEGARRDRGGAASPLSISKCAVYEVICELGAGAEIRTRTPLRAADFKSAASTCSATPAGRQRSRRASGDLVREGIIGPVARPGRTRRWRRPPRTRKLTALAAIAATRTPRRISVPASRSSALVVRSSVAASRTRSAPSRRAIAAVDWIPSAAGVAAPMMASPAIAPARRSRSTWSRWRYRTSHSSYGTTSVASGPSIASKAAAAASSNTGRSGGVAAAGQPAPSGGPRWPGTRR